MSQPLELLRKRLDAAEQEMDDASADHSATGTARFFKAKSALEAAHEALAVAERAELARLQKGQQ